MKEIQDIIRSLSSIHNIEFCLDIKTGTDHYSFGQIPKLINLQSVSKEFVKMAILLLDRRGSLSLSDSVLKYIDITDNHKSMVKFYDWKGWRKITIENLLNHESGIVDFINEMHDFDDVDHIGYYDVLRACAKFPLHFEAGTERLYSNSNYYILSFIIERLLHPHYFIDTFVFEKILNRDVSYSTLPIGNIPVTYDTKSHVSEIPGFYKALPWPEYKTKGIFAMSVDDLHQFVFNIPDMISSIYYDRWFHSSQTLIDSYNYRLYHSLMGSSDTGNIIVHSMDVGKKVSIVMYCDAYSERILDTFTEIGDKVLGVINKLLTEKK